MLVNCLESGKRPFLENHRQRRRVAGAGAGRRHLDTEANLLGRLNAVI